MSNTWRVAECLETLLGQVNERWPTRKKDSDGTIGDARHQAERTSDHNPWVRDGQIGVVTALDITHDPASGCDAGKLAEAMRVSRDPRIKYIISNRRICSGSAGPSPWVWRPYSGVDDHSHHLHLSVKSTKADYDYTGPWSAVTIQAVPILKSKIATAQVVEGAVVTAGGGVGIASQVMDVGNSVQTIATVVDQSGQVIDKTVTIGKQIPHGFWENVVVTIHSPTFIICMTLISLAICGMTFYWRRQHAQMGV